LTDKRPIDMITDEELIRELVWLATHKEMTESRGTKKPVIDMKVKLSAIEAIARAKGMEGFKGSTAEKQTDTTHWNDLKKALGKAATHGEKEAM